MEAKNMIKWIIGALFAGGLFVGTAFATPTTSQYMPDNIMQPLTPGVSALDLRAVANVAQSQTDSVLVAAVAGKKIRVTAVVTQAGAVATNITFNTKGAGAGVAISPVFANAANIPNPLTFNPMGWFETASGEGLTVTTGAGSTTGILVVYTTY
jgi:hypothetical protein